MDWSRAETWQATAYTATTAAAHAVISTALFIWGASRVDIKARSLHCIMNTAGKLPIMTAAVYYRDAEWCAVLAVPVVAQKERRFD